MALGSGDLIHLTKEETDVAASVEKEVDGQLIQMSEEGSPRRLAYEIRTKSEKVAIWVAARYVGKWPKVTLVQTRQGNFLLTIWNFDFERARM